MLLVTLLFYVLGLTKIFNKLAREQRSFLKLINSLNILSILNFSEHTSECTPELISKKVYNISNITSISNALNVLIALACLVLCTQYILYLLKNPGLTPELTSKIIFLNILNISERTPERTPELISKFVSVNILKISECTPELISKFVSKN